MIAPMPAAGFATPFAYDALGRQVASTDPLANTVHTAYDPEGRVLARWGATYPVLYAYDARGNLVSATVDGVSTNLYAYDVFGNMTNEVQNGSVIARDYDAFGRPTGYALGSGGAGGSPAETDANVAYSYDTLGRFASVTFGTNVFEYSRLPGTDLVTGYTCGSFSRWVSYEPHRDLVSAVTNVFGSTRISTFGYANDAAGRRTAISRGGAAFGALSGATDAYGYNARSEVTSARRTLGADPISGFAFDYAYDPIGNRVSATEYDESGAPLFAEYAANELNQYIRRTVPGYAAVRGEADTNATVTVNERPVSRTGAYFHGGDYADNTLSNLYHDLEIYAAINPPGTNVPDTVYAITSQVFVAKTPEAFTYDADGNMTSDGRFTYTWNADNRMVMASNDAVVVTYAYDHRGRMVKKDIMRSGSDPVRIEYLWDNWNIIREVVRDGDSGAITDNIWGLDLDGTLQGAGGVGGLLAVIVPRPMGEGQGEGGTAYLPCYDANGNITEYVSTNGEVVAHYDYSPFGEQLVASGPLADTFTHRFSTKPWCPVTGFSEYQMRKYHPDIGRWMSRDPIGEKGGLNQYAFPINSPLCDIDLLGLLDCNKNNEGTRRGISNRTVFSPGERNPDDVKEALDITLTILILSDMPIPKLSDLGDLANKLNPNLPWGMDVSAVALHLTSFNRLLRLTAGVATIWTKVQCQECKCTNLFTGWPLYRSKSDFAWKNIGDEHRYKCDLEKTKWGAAQRKMPGGNVKITGGGGVMFEMLTSRDIESLKTQCSEQASESCGR